MEIFYVIIAAFLFLGLLKKTFGLGIKILLFGIGLALLLKVVL